VDVQSGLPARMALPVTYGDSGLRDNEGAAMSDMDKYPLNNWMGCYTPSNPVPYAADYQVLVSVFAHRLVLPSPSRDRRTISSTRGFQQEKLQLDL